LPDAKSDLVPLARDDEASDPQRSAAGMPAAERAGPLATTNKAMFQGTCQTLPPAARIRVCSDVISACLADTAVWFLVMSTLMSFM
jgi:hypothetical protein